MGYDDNISHDLGGLSLNRQRSPSPGPQERGLNQVATYDKVTERGGPNNGQNEDDDEWSTGQKIAAGIGGLALTGGAIFGAKKWMDSKQDAPIPPKPQEEEGWSKGKIAAVVGGGVAAAAAVGYGVHKYRENQAEDEREERERVDSGDKQWTDNKQAQPTPTPAQEEDEGWSKGKIAAVVGGGVAAAAALGYGVHKYRENKEEDEREERERQNYGDKKRIEGTQAPPFPPKPAQEEEQGWSKGKIAAVVGGGVATAAAVGYGVHKYRENKEDEREQVFGDKKRPDGQQPFGDKKRPDGQQAFGDKKRPDGKQAHMPPAQEERGWSKGKIAAAVGGGVATAAAVGYGVHKYKENKEEDEREEREREDKRRREEQRRQDERRDAERREREKKDPDAGLSAHERGLREHQRQIAAHLKMEDDYRRMVERR